MKCKQCGGEVHVSDGDTSCSNCGYIGGHLCPALVDLSRDREVDEGACQTCAIEITELKAEAERCARVREQAMKLVKTCLKKATGKRFDKAVNDLAVALAK